MTAKTQSDFTAGAIFLMGRDGVGYIVPMALRRMDIDGVVKAVAVSWALWKQRLGEVLRACRIEEGAAGTPAIQRARTLALQARVRVSEIERALAGRALGKPEAQRTNEEVAALRKVAATQPPTTDWSAREWEAVRTAPPLVLNSYRPGSGMEGNCVVGDIVARAHLIVPTLMGRTWRLVASPDASGQLSREWLGQLLALPNGKHDDAVQATIGGVLPFVEAVNDEDGISAELLAFSRRQDR